MLNWFLRVSAKHLKKLYYQQKKTSKQNLTIPVIPDYYLHFVSINHEKKIEAFIDVTSDCKFRCILCLILENRIKQLITRTNELYEYRYVFSIILLIPVNLMYFAWLILVLLFFILRKCKRFFIIFYVQILHLLH